MYLIRCWARPMYLLHNDPKIADVQDTQKVFYFKIRPVLGSRSGGIYPLLYKSLNSALDQLYPVSFYWDSTKFAVL